MASAPNRFLVFADEERVGCSDRVGLRSRVGVKVEAVRGDG